MKILVTGGAGFIGSNVVASYLKKGDEVIIYDNLFRKGVEKNLKWLQNEYTNLNYCNADIRDFTSLKKQIKGTQLVYHMASQVAVTTSVNDPRTDFEINALGTLNVLEAARNLSKPPIIIYASTNKVYGNLDHIKLKISKSRYNFTEHEFLEGIDERMQLDFHSPYGCSKGSGDQYTRDYARIYGLKTIVFRQSCIYGDRQFGNEDQGWVAHFTKCAIKNQPLTIYGDGKQVRDLLYISDLLNCYKKAIQKINITAGQIYNIGGGIENSASLLELIKILEKKLKKTIKVTYKKWRQGDQKIYISNINKAYNDFQWKPQFSLTLGIDKLICWIKSVC